MRNIFIFIFTLLVMIRVQAHAIWIETNSKAMLGDRHEVKIIFAEPSEMDKPVPSMDWYSDLGKLELVLTTPSGKKIILDKKAKELYYSAYFDIKEKGIYKLSINHLVAKVYKRMKIRYQAVAFVSTLSSNENIILGDKKYFQIGLDTKPILENQKYQILYKKNKFENQEIVFDFLANKKIKNTTNFEGVVEIKPDSSKKYIMNVTKQISNKGQFNGRKHEWDYVWLTYMFSNEN